MPDAALAATPAGNPAPATNSFSLSAWLTDHGNPSFPTEDPCRLNTAACNCNQALRFVPSGREVLVCNGFDRDKAPTRRVLLLAGGNLLVALRIQETDTCDVARNGIPVDEVQGTIALHFESQGDALVIDERKPTLPLEAPAMKGGCNDCRTFASMMRTDARAPGDRAWAGQKAAATSRICDQIGHYVWQGNTLVKLAAKPTVPAVAPAPTMTVPTPPWIQLRTGIVLRTTFAIDDDGAVSFSSNDGSEWHGNVERRAIERVEDVIRKNKFCELANSEETHHLKSSMTISLHGMSCSVTLSYPTWKKNVRAREVYRAMREVMKATCADACSSASSGLPPAE